MFKRKVQIEQGNIFLDDEPEMLEDQDETFQQEELH
jgi:hypothetical protein